MNYKNNEMLTSPNLSYTSRDYKSIFTDLINSIPLLTKEWDPKDENDPGVVLIKLMSMLGDMLSYNLDKNALEAFNRTVLQRGNAQQLFRLVGYKMHWWRSAVCEVQFINSQPIGLYITPYNVFSTSKGDIIYTNVDSISIPGNNGNINNTKATLVQGRPVTPVLNGSVKPIDYNANWYDNYDYNVLASNIKNNRLQLNYKNIDETSILLIDNDSQPFALNEWRLVDNINTVDSLDKVFEFCVDEDNIPYLQFPDYWNTKYIITKFKIFFILSDGSNGEIRDNMLSIINSSKCYVTESGVDVNSVISGITMLNTTSTYGYKPETCTEARINAEKYVNTLDTLVTLTDFEKALKRVDSIANVIATDLATDPYGDQMTADQINLYLVRKNDYNTSGENYIYSISGADVQDSGNDELFKSNILSELEQYKLKMYDVNILLENRINWIDWTVSGQIYLRTPINTVENNQLMVKINDNLRNRFNCETLDFNEPINYMDVIECIMKTDSNIWHVDLNTAAIQYSRIKRDIYGDPIGTTIQNKYMIYDSANQYTYFYLNSLGCSDIEINKISPYKDVYVDGLDDDIVPNFTAGTGENSLTKSINYEGNITSGGNGFGKNIGNKITREDGVSDLIDLQLDEFNIGREYEVYNRRIYNWSGKEPIFTGLVIDTQADSQNRLKIKRYVKNPQYSYGSDKPEYILEDTGYYLLYTTKMYLSDGSDAHRTLKMNYRQISSLCDNLDEDENIFDIEELQALVNQANSGNNDAKSKLLLYIKMNIVREVYDIYDEVYDEWTGQTIDKITGGIYFLRGKGYYSAHQTYDESTGNILDYNGGVLYAPGSTLIREPACQSDITGEYIQSYEVDGNTSDFSFYLGQDSMGRPLTDENNHIIEAYPIKPKSLYIYVYTDYGEEIIGDNGSGKLLGTGNVLNGYGTIDYTTGEVNFKLNLVPYDNLKIMYKINEFNYARYVMFDYKTFFVRPEYIRSDDKK